MKLRGHILAGGAKKTNGGPGLTMIFLILWYRQHWSLSTFTASTSPGCFTSMTVTHSFQSLISSSSEWLSKYFQSELSKE